MWHFILFIFRYDGKFDLSLLDDLRPFFRASLKHKNREIRNKTHQMWQLTFAGSITDEKDIPNDISDLLKETEKSLENTSLSVCSFQKNMIKAQIFWEGLQKFGPSSTLFFLRYLVVSNYKWNMAQISDRNIEIVGKH